MKSPADLSWDDLRVAVAAARLGSLSAVARKLDLSVATVGRRLDRLEAALGVKLFHRHSGGLIASPEAQALLARADGVADKIDDLVRAAAAGVGAAEGIVTVTTLETIITHVIAPRLPELLARYPRLQVVLRGTNRIERLDRRRADLAVRVVRPNEARVVGKKLGTQHLALYASASYIAQHGRPPSPATDLRGHHVVMFDEAWDTLAEMAWLAERLGDTKPVVRVTSISAAAAVVRSGTALGILPTTLETPELDRLVGVESIPARDLWLVMHEDLRAAPHVRAVADFLAEVFRDALRP
ncbi:MAG: LysR family transcriptional regulator [Deltaproteobacteria bacterium]|nr:LysR family transcriptional regulator [Deltaproteobacteria bacterium]